MKSLTKVYEAEMGGMTVALTAVRRTAQVRHEHDQRRDGDAEDRV